MRSCSGRRADVLVVADVVDIRKELQLILLREGEALLQTDIVHNRTPRLIRIQPQPWNRDVEHAAFIDTVPRTAGQSVRGILAAADGCRIRQAVLHRERIAEAPVIGQVA